MLVCAEKGWIAVFRNVTNESLYSFSTVVCWKAVPSGNIVGIVNCTSGLTTAEADPQLIGYMEPGETFDTFRDRRSVEWELHPPQEDKL
jgi:hypothetical protein